MDYPTNIYALAAIVVLALSGGLGGYAVQQRRTNGHRSNGALSEDRVRWLIAEHERDCPRVNDLRDDLRGLRDEVRALRDELREMWRAQAGQR